MSKELAEKLENLREWLVLHQNNLGACAVDEAIAALRAEPVAGQLSAETIKAVRKHWDNCSDVVALCDMALESLRGTFADGVEAAAKAAHDALRDIDRAHAEIAYSAATSALAQGQRESNSNPAPMHGQSKTWLTESHSGAPTQEADDLLRGLRRKLFRGGITAADWDVIDAYLSRKEQ